MSDQLTTNIFRVCIALVAFSSVMGAWRNIEQQTRIEALESKVRELESRSEWMASVDASLSSQVSRLQRGGE